MKNGDAVVPRLNRVIKVAESAGVPIFYTRDWHPRNHMSFREQGGIWPPHCVQGTEGAMFHADLKVPATAVIISKGDDPRKEAYSGFQGTDLTKRLKALGIDEVFIGGLTTDYCVKESSLDALHDGFVVDVMTDCTRAVNVRPGDGRRALQAAKKAGAKLTTSRAAMKRLAGAQHYHHHPDLSGQS